VHTLKAAEKQLSLGVHLLGDHNRSRLGDPYRLLQILHNLIGNAVKFTNQGAVGVDIDCRQTDRIVVTVTDTGIGMSAQALAAVFDDFGQADSTIARRFGGTGLGMPIVKRLVAMMSGTIHLDSAPGRGTQVIVELPLPVADPADMVDAGEVVPAALPDLSHLRILAADDNRTNRMILGAMLGQLGVSAVLVPDGHAALRAFEPKAFDVVILDISMPDIDGIEVMRRLRSRMSDFPRETHPEILAFTANAMAHQVEAYLQAGFDSCLTKPLQLSKLSKALQDVCAARQFGARGRRPATGGLRVAAT